MHPAAVKIAAKSFIGSIFLPPTLTPRSSARSFVGELAEVLGIDKRAGAGKAPQLHKPVLDLEKRLVEVGDDVVDVFDADGEADETIGDADAVANFLWHGSVSHERGQGDERFDAAEAFGEGAKLHMMKEAARAIE